MVKLATVTLPESFFSLIFLKYSLHLENALRWRSITEGCFWLLPHQTTNLASLNYMQKLLKTFKRCPGLFLSILHTLNSRSNAQKMKFSIKDFFNKCDQMRSFLRIWSHLLKKSSMKNFFFWAERRPMPRGYQWSRKLFWTLNMFKGMKNSFKHLWWSIFVKEITTSNTPP